jgi:uncharacterized membrane protein YkoI
MNTKRRLAIAAVALLLVGSTAVVAIRSSAQTSAPAPQASAQTQVATAPDDEKVVGADTDQVDEQVEEQVGDQNAVDTVEAADSIAEAPEGADGQDAAPAGTPSITADQAKATAEAYLNAGTATKVELDDENGKLIYSVEIGTSDVKVDAMTNAVLGVDSGLD